MKAVARAVGKQPQTSPQRVAPDLSDIRAGMASLRQEVTDLDFGKANASTVGGLVTKVNSVQDAMAMKADASALTAVAQDVAGKADVSALAAKADASAVAAVSDTVAKKADKSDIPQPADTAPPAVQISSEAGAVLTLCIVGHGRCRAG